MKQYQKCFLFLIWGMVIFQLFVNFNAKNEYKVIEAFEASKSIPIDGKVMVSGSLGNQDLNQKTKKNLLISLAKKIGIQKDYQIETKREDGVKTMILKREDGAEGIWLRISSSNGYHYLSTEVEVEEIGTMLTIKEQLESLLKENGIRTESSFYMRGDFKKRLNRREKNEVEEKLLAILDAKMVLDYKDEYSDTIYAYSKRLSNYYERNGDKMNLQLILHYNEASNNTQLYLAVPFYNESY